MNRLTFKCHCKNGTEYYRYAHKWKRIGNTNISTSNKYSQITQKLGKLEDIEEELGISLEVLFKALKDGIYYDYDGDIIDFSYATLFNDEDDCEWYLTTDSATFVELKNYGKTWALTKEELE